MVKYRNFNSGTKILLIHYRLIIDRFKIDLKFMA